MRGCEIFVFVHFDICELYFYIYQKIFPWSEVDVSLSGDGKAREDVGWKAKANLLSANATDSNAAAVEQWTIHKASFQVPNAKHNVAAECNRS